MIHFFRRTWPHLKKGIVSAGVTSLLMVTVGTTAFVIHQRDYKTPIRIRTTQTEHRLRVGLAVTPEEHALGLMFVKSLPKNGGKLFVYEAPQTISFWMKNMRFPLDILFIGKDFKIKHIVYEAPVCDLAEGACPLFSSPDPFQYVLELPAGYAKNHQVEVGDELLLGY